MRAPNYTFDYAVSFHFNGKDHEKTMRIFVNELNKAVFRNAVQDFGYQLEIFGVRQLDKTGHHVHLAIGGFPKGCRPHPKYVIRQTMKRIRGIWKAHTKIKRITDKLSFEGHCGQDGWIRYSTRELENSDDILVQQHKFSSYTDK